MNQPSPCRRIREKLPARRDCHLSAEFSRILLRNRLSAEFSRIPLRNHLARRDPMSATQRCPKCGQEFSADAPGGLCPVCLLKQGQESGSVSAEVERTLITAGYTPPQPE